MVRPTANNVSEFGKSWGWLIALIVIGLSSYGERAGWWTPEQGAMIRAVPLPMESEPAKVTPPVPVLQLIVTDSGGQPIEAPAVGSVQVDAGRLIMVTSSGSVGPTDWRATPVGQCQAVRIAGVGYAFLLEDDSAWVDAACIDWSGQQQSTVRIAAKARRKPDPVDPPPDTKPQPQISQPAVDALLQYGRGVADAFEAAARQYDQHVPASTIAADMATALKPARVESFTPLMQKLNELRPAAGATDAQKAASDAASAAVLRAWAVQLRGPKTTQVDKSAAAIARLDAIIDAIERVNP